MGQSFLGSVSTYSYGAIGGHSGRYLKAGDILECGASIGATRSLQKGHAPLYSDMIMLRTLPGPEFDILNRASKSMLLGKCFTAGRQTDRMGACLDGPLLQLISKTQMSSSALLPGTVQCPPNGQPILMLADGHCTGGYPRLLQVIRADRYLLGQIKTGTRVFFKMSNTDEAKKILQRRTAFFKSLMPDFSF